MFLNLVMLAGLGGAVVPLVLHMLSRSRYRSVDWGAMMFLRGAKARSGQSTRLKQIVLLAMRMGIVALLAVALARPIARGQWGMVAREGPVTAILIFDRSYSMQCEEGGRTRFELGREAALQILSGLRPGDRAGLVLAGEAADPPFDEPTSDVQALARYVAELKSPAGGVADLAGALGRAADLLEGSEAVGREIYVITDRQALNWRDVNAAFAAAWRQRMAGSHAPTRLLAIPVGGDEGDNVVVESVDVLTSPLIRDMAAEVEVRARNYGRSKRSVPLTVAVQRAPGDETRLYRRTISVEANSQSTARLTVTMGPAHSQIISARIDAAGLSVDNRFDLAAAVVDRLKVLIVSGDERADAATLRGESAFVQLALTPYRDRGNIAEVTVRRAQEWAGPPLKGYNVVILANVPQFTAAQVRALEQFVYEGGGVFIAPGGLARIDHYNEMLYRDGAGILPAKLQAPASADWSASTTLGTLDLSHPIFAQVRGWEPAPTAAIAHYFPASPAAEARVVGSYATGEPFLIEAASGRGRVLLMTTPLDLDWGNLPLTNFYLPFIQSSVRYLTYVPPARRNVTPGEPLVAYSDEPVDERNVDVTPPDERPFERSALRVSPAGQQWQVQYSDTRAPGLYRMHFRGGTIHFIVQPPRDESDLTPLSGERWAELERVMGLARLEPGRQGVGAAVAGARSGREMWLVCVLGVLGLAVVELWAAGKWSAGS